MLTFRSALQPELCCSEPQGHSLLHDIVVVSDLLWVDVTMSMVKVKIDCRVFDVPSTDACAFTSR